MNEQMIEYEEVQSLSPANNEVEQNSDASVVKLSLVKSSESANIRPGMHSHNAFDLMNRIAKAFSSSELVPQIYRGPSGVANCLIALNMAYRMGVDELMVMQNLHIIQGKPGFSSQFLIGTFNGCNRFSTLQYEFFGDEGTEGWGCFAYCTDLKSGEKLRGTKVTLKLAKEEGWSAKSGSKWKTMPEQMLRYRAAAFLIRAYAPEIALGMHTVEELNDIKKTEDRH